MNIDILIPQDDSVRLLSQILEGLNYRKLYKAYSRLGRKQVSPKHLFKILVYGYMNNIYSSRKLETACKRDINFMFLLNGTKAPDHNTIARFRSERLTKVIEDLFYQLVKKLKEIDEISAGTLFVDGTKFEANANRYTFVWKKSTQKNMLKLQEKLKIELPGICEKFNIRYPEELTVCELKRIYCELDKMKADEFVHGKGKRTSDLQKAMEKVRDFHQRQERYENYQQTLGKRNSFSKTDNDATFMRLKDDHMKNGQLKPAYNVQLGVDSEYIVGVYVSNERSDVNTLIPLLSQMRKGLGFIYEKLIADAGYEGEENYLYLEKHKQIAFIKPLNYERKKKRKYQKDISLRENMIYDEEKDLYVCSQGKQIEFVYETKTKSKTGYASKTSVYECFGCEGCASKKDCIKSSSKEPLEERNKRLYVSKEFLRCRKACEERITSPEGIKLRINRSIQSEGAFGVIKEDMEFRRFLLRGNEKVKTEILLLSMGYNITKLHNKIQSGRCGQHLHEIA